jgi:hypothetical protein
MAGARCVQVGTANFAEPGAILRSHPRAADPHGRARLRVGRRGRGLFASRGRPRSHTAPREAGRRVGGARRRRACARQRPKDHELPRRARACGPRTAWIRCPSADARSRNSLAGTPRRRCPRPPRPTGGRAPPARRWGPRRASVCRGPESSGGLRLRPLLRCRPPGRRGARAGSGYPSFNAFFTRPLRPGARPVDDAFDAVVAPSDGLLRSVDRDRARHDDHREGPRLHGRRAARRRGRRRVVRRRPRDHHLPPPARLPPRAHPVRRGRSAASRWSRAACCRSPTPRWPACRGCSPSTSASIHRLDTPWGRWPW